MDPYSLDHIIYLIPTLVRPSSIKESDLVKINGGKGIRTPDTRLAKPVL